MNFEGSLEDRLQIRERYGSYADATFQSDLEAFLDNWADDCIWQVLGVEMHGKEGIRGAWNAVWAPMERISYFSEIGAIAVHGDRATARSYCRETLFLKDGGIRELLGEYTDAFVRENGTWLFARRDHRLLHDSGAGTPLPVEAA
jgi:uncharacterized protein (TIGR02246 family)